MALDRDPQQQPRVGSSSPPRPICPISPPHCRRAPHSPSWPPGPTAPNSPARGGGEKPGPPPRHPGASAAGAGAACGEPGGRCLGGPIGSRTDVPALTLLFARDKGEAGGFWERRGAVSWMPGLLPGETSGGWPGASRAAGGIVPLLSSAQRSCHQHGQAGGGLWEHLPWWPWGQRVPGCGFTRGRDRGRQRGARVAPGRGAWGGCPASKGQRGETSPAQLLGGRGGVVVMGRDEEPEGPCVPPPQLDVKRCGGWPRQPSAPGWSAGQGWGRLALGMGWGGRGG